MLNQLSPAYLLPGETGLTFLMIALPRCQVRYYHVGLCPHGITLLKIVCHSWLEVMIRLSDHVLLTSYVTWWYSRRKPGLQIPPSPGVLAPLSLLE